MIGASFKHIACRAMPTIPRLWTASLWVIYSCWLPSSDGASQSLSPPHRYICWFRSDLRLHDNPLLSEAASHEGRKEVLPVYIFDPRSFDGERDGWERSRTGPIRAQFLLQSVIALRQALRQIGSDLLVGVGPPETLLPLLARTVGGGEALEDPFGIFGQATMPVEGVEIDPFGLFGGVFFSLSPNFPICHTPFSLYITSIYFFWRRRREGARVFLRHAGDDTHLSGAGDAL